MSNRPELLETDQDNLGNPARIAECQHKGHRPLVVNGAIMRMPLIHPAAQRPFGWICCCRRCGLMYWEILDEFKNGFLATHQQFPPAQGAPVQGAPAGFAGAPGPAAYGQAPYPQPPAGGYGPAPGASAPYPPHYAPPQGHPAQPQPPPAGTVTQIDPNAEGSGS